MSRKSVRSPDAALAGETQPSTPELVSQIQDHIGRQLRSIYDDVLNQPVPDRFRELMEKLDNPGGGAAKPGEDAS